MKISISKYFFFLIVLICALIDMIVLGYWAGVYNDYDPYKHRASIGFEYTFGKGAMSRLWQLIIANLFCFIVYVGTGVAIYLLCQKCKSKANGIQMILSGLTILAIFARIFWFYTETRQFIVSVKTVTRRYEEIHYKNNIRAQIKNNEYKRSESSADPGIGQCLFNELCLNYEKELIILDGDTYYNLTYIPETGEYNNLPESKSAQIQEGQGQGAAIAKNVTHTPQEQQQKFPFYPRAFGAGTHADAASHRIDKLKLKRKPTFCIYEYELLFVDCVVIPILLIFQLYGLVNLILLYRTCCCTCSGDSDGNATAEVPEVGGPDTHESLTYISNKK